MELSKAQISVDVFSFAPYADLATLGSCAKVTGGKVRLERARAVFGMRLKQCVCARARSIITARMP